MTESMEEIEAKMRQKLKRKAKEASKDKQTKTAEIIWKRSTYWSNNHIFKMKMLLDFREQAETGMDNVHMQFGVCPQWKS